MDLAVNGASGKARQVQMNTCPKAKCNLLHDILVASMLQQFTFWRASVLPISRKLYILLFTDFCVPPLNFYGVEHCMITRYNKGMQHRLLPSPNITSMCDLA